jgi:hypothetical protein
MLLDGRMRMFWTQHHSIIDGWSQPIILGDILGSVLGQTIQASGATFRDHVAWTLKQPVELSGEFWRKALENANQTSRLNFPEPDFISDDTPKYGTFSKDVNLPNLSQMCRNQNVTIGTALRLAWGIMLKHFTRSDYVIFSTVTSGRDSGVENSARYPFLSCSIVSLISCNRTVGMLLNTIPVPAHLPSDMLVSEALQQLQNFHAGSIQHSYLGLTDIQKLSGIPLIDKLDTNLVFENFPTPEAPRSEEKPRFTINFVDGQQVIIPE